MAIETKPSRKGPDTRTLLDEVKLAMHERGIEEPSDLAIGEYLKSSQQREALAGDLSKSTSVREKYGKDVAALEGHLEKLGSNLLWLQATRNGLPGKEAKLDKNEQKQGWIRWSLGKLKDLALYPVRHPVKTVIAAAIVLAAVVSWNFRGYILAWLQKWLSQIAQSQQEVSMGRDSTINRPLPDVRPNPDVPTWNENPLPSIPRSPDVYPKITPPPLPPSV